MFKFDCVHGRHETVTEARNCQGRRHEESRGSYDTPEWSNRLLRQSAGNAAVRRSVLGTPAPVDFTGGNKLGAPTFSAPLARKYNHQTDGFPDVAAGHYAVEVDGALKFYEVARPTEGKWKGYTFLSVQASDEKHAIRNPGTKKAILALVHEDPKAAMLRYGQEIGRCGHCHRTLTDAESRARGIGPVCAGKMGY